MMSKLKAKNNLLLLASSCLVGYLAYELLLTDEAKQTLKNSIYSVSENIKNISNEIKIENKNIDSKLDVYKIQKQTSDEWERLGF